MENGKELVQRLTDDEIEQSKQKAQKRLDEDTERVGSQRGELFQNKDGSWSISYSIKTGGTIGLKAEFSAVHKRKDELKGIRQGTSNKSKSVDFDGANFKESTVVEKKTPKNQRELERAAVTRILPHFNQHHNTSFVIGDELPEESDIKDIVIEDSNNGETIGIQVTVSDADAEAHLGREGAHSRQGNTYDIFSQSIKAAISKKGTLKYSEPDRNKTILVLDGWQNATPQVLQRLKTDEQAFLKDQGYREIWFAGTIDETVARLL